VVKEYWDIIFLANCLHLLPGRLIITAINNNGNYFFTMLYLLSIMKKLFLIVFAGIFFAKPIMAAPYVSGSIGSGSLTNSNATYGGVISSNMITYKSGVPFCGALGIKSDACRIEVALGYQSQCIGAVKHDGKYAVISSHTLSILSYMLNSYYDFDIKGCVVSPYLNAGIGGARLTEKGVGTPDETSNGFAWQLGGGFSVKASEHIGVDFGYRYFKPSAYNANRASDITVLSHNFMAGFRYNF